jgi:hypothetical protein
MSEISRLEICGDIILHKTNSQFNNVAEATNRVYFISMKKGRTGRVRWADHVARMAVMRYAYKMLVG